MRAVGNSEKNSDHYGVRLRTPSPTASAPQRYSKLDTRPCLATLSPRMLGTILNAVGIVLGGIIGLWRPEAVNPKQERTFQVLLGAFTVFYGLRLVVISCDPPFTHILKQFGIIILSLMLGRLVGSLLRLQRLSNRIGMHARETFTAHAKG